jgi:hypothetical protein
MIPAITRTTPRLDVDVHSQSLSQLLLEHKSYVRIHLEKCLLPGLFDCHCLRWRLEEEEDKDRGDATDWQVDPEAKSVSKNTSQSARNVNLPPAPSGSVCKDTAQNWA